VIANTNRRHPGANSFNDTCYLMPQDGWKLMRPGTFKKKQIAMTYSGSHNSNKNLSALWLINLDILNSHRMAHFSEYGCFHNESLLDDQNDELSLPVELLSAQVIKSNRANKYSSDNDGVVLGWNPSQNNCVIHQRQKYRAGSHTGNRSKTPKEAYAAN
jgi:hypothetical protein